MKMRSLLGCYVPGLVMELKVKENGEDEVEATRLEAVTTLLLTMQITPPAQDE